MKGQTAWRRSRPAFSPLFEQDMETRSLEMMIAGQRVGRTPFPSQMGGGY
jgi:hypothetical protein